MKNSTIFLVILLLAGEALIGIAAGGIDKQYESSQKCKNCHEQIYNEWNESMHAQAMVDPAFLGMLAQQKDKAMCISCHAPTTRLTGDFNLTDAITNEAITCDFCHTVSGLNTSNPLQPFLLNPGEVKYGQYNDSVSQDHEAQYLEVLTKSEFCAACHEVIFPNGVVVLGTYTEWKNSDYAKNGIQCQTCHMRPIKRSIATGSAERNDSSRHEWRGGHSIDMVKEAGNLELYAKVQGKKVYVTAVITNDRAGHKLPTGDVSQLILKIQATDKDGNKLFENETIFSKVFGDANGSRVIVPDIATQILSDNRIPPNDKSTSKFTFKVPGYKDDVNITAVLLYRPAPEELNPAPAIKIIESTKIINMVQTKRPTEIIDNITGVPVVNESTADILAEDFMNFGNDDSYNITITKVADNTIVYTANGTLQGLTKETIRINWIPIDTGDYILRSEASDVSSTRTVLVVDQRIIAPVPELSTLALVSAGLIGLFGLVRLRIRY